MQVLLTSTHLAIVMEYAAGGEIFERICNAGRFSEDEVSIFIQQVLSEEERWSCVENVGWRFLFALTC